MHYALAAGFVFAVLTLWAPGYWPVAAFQVWMFALAIAVMIRGVRSSVLQSVPCLVLAAAAVWGLIQLGAGWTPVAYETKLAVLKWLSVLASFLVASHVLIHSASRDWFRRFMVIFAAIVALEATFQTFTDRGNVFWLFRSDARYMMMGPIIYHNHFAAFVEAVLPMALYEGFQDRRHALPYFGAAAILMGSVIVSASRSGVIICGVELLLVLLLMWSRSSQQPGMRRHLLQAVAVVGVVVIVMGWQAAASRFKLDDPFTIRRELAQSTVQMIKERPLTGFGLGTWPNAYPRFAVIDIGLVANRAHSDWLEWAAEGGLVFVALFGALALWSVRPAFETVWGLGILGVFAEAAIDYPFSRPALASWALLLVAMMVGRQSARSAQGHRKKQSVSQPTPVIEY